MITLSVSELRRLGACDHEVNIFSSLCPDGETSPPITVEAITANSKALNWDWAAKRLLPESAQAEYRNITAPAFAKYSRIEESASRAMADQPDAWEEHEGRMEAANAEYMRIKATAFGRLYVAARSATLTPAK